MICKQLMSHWFMCLSLRRPTVPQMRDSAVRYFTAQKQLVLSSKVETKALHYVNDFSKPKPKRQTT